MLSLPPRPARMPLPAWVALSSQCSSPLGCRSASLVCSYVAKQAWLECWGAWAVAGNWPMPRAISIHTLHRVPGESKHVCSSRAKSRLPPALLLVSPGLQLAKGVHLSGIGFQHWRAQYLAQIIHSPGRIFAHVISLLFWVPFKRLDLMGIFPLIPIPCGYSLQPW